MGALSKCSAKTRAWHAVQKNGDFDAPLTGAICTSFSKTQTSCPPETQTSKLASGPVSCCLRINAEYSLAFKEDGAGGQLFSASASKFCHCLSVSGLGMVPLPPKVFSRTCQ